MTSLTLTENLDAATSNVNKENFLENLNENNLILEKSNFSIGNFEIFNNSTIEFCKNNNIDWMPGHLTFTDSGKILHGEIKKKKVLDKINHEFYNFGYPRCNDFKNKPETVKKRQSLIYDEKYKDLFNCIMIDTSNIYHVDIDTPDYHNCYDIMMEKYPYYKSMTKSYGCHIFIDSK